MKRQEQEHCIAFMDWVRMQSPSIRELLAIIHIPNEGKRSVVTGVILKRMGMRPGAWDYMLPLPRVYGGALRAGLIIEFKSERGRLSASQEEWGETMRRLGFASIVVRDWEVAKTAVLDYLGVGSLTTELTVH